MNIATGELTIGNLLGEQARLVKTNVLPCAGFTIGMALLATACDLALPVDSTFANIPLSIASAIAQCALTTHILRRQGFPVDDRTGRRFGAYFGLGVLSGLGILIGGLLFVVPGIIVAARWLPSAAILIGEDQGVTDALGESWRRTRDHTGKLAAVTLIVAGLFALLLIAVVALTFAMEGTSVGSGEAAAMFPLYIALYGLSVGWTVMGIATYRLLQSPVQPLKDVFA